MVYFAKTKRLDNWNTT